MLDPDRVSAAALASEAEIHLRSFEPGRAVPFLTALVAAAGDGLHPMARRQARLCLRALLPLVEQACRNLRDWKEHGR